MSAFWKILKKLWRNPRTHAVLVMGIYALFFGILFLLLNIKSTSSTYVTAETYFSQLTTYDYQMMIKAKDQIYHLQGNRENESETFYVEEMENTYQVLSGNIVDENQTSVSSFNWNLLTPTKLSQLMTHGVVNATTNYKDGSQKTEYEADCKVWNPSMTGICQLQVTKKEERIVELILTVVDSYTIEIQYFVNEKQ